MKPHQLVLTAITASIFLMSQNASADNPLSNAQVKQVKEVVHDYLVTNPEVLIEASHALQKRETQKKGEETKGAIVDNATALFADPKTPVVGNPKGSVTLIEFFDYQCPHCKEMKGPIEKLIASDANLRVLYKELPIFGQTSKDASAAALAAAKQGDGKYLTLHNALLTADNPLSKDKVLEIAKSVGLDTTKLAQDMDAPAVQKQIEDNFQLAQALNLVGTPTFVISKWQVGSKTNNVKNAVFIPGMPTAEELKAAVDSAK